MLAPCFEPCSLTARQHRTVGQPVHLGIPRCEQEQSLQTVSCRSLLFPPLAGHGVLAVKQRPALKELRRAHEAGLEKTQTQTQSQTENPDKGLRYTGKCLLLGDFCSYSFESEDKATVLHRGMERGERQL